MKKKKKLRNRKKFLCFKKNGWNILFSKKNSKSHILNIEINNLDS